MFIILKDYGEYSITKYSAEYITSQQNAGVNLNKLTVLGFATSLNNLKNKPDFVYLDSADIKTERFVSEVSKLLTFKPRYIFAEHKADSKYKVVGAASIVAKVTRDESVLKLGKTIKYNIGSGYPSDPITVLFLKELFERNEMFTNLSYIRYNWSTISRFALKE